MIDLHTHSTASDGLLTPSELIHYAASKGVSVLALTDHDTDAGLSEAAATASSCGIVFVPGIELNIQWPTGEFHLLGLGLKTTSKELQSIINILQETRRIRNKKILQKMHMDGIDVQLEDIQQLFPSRSLGRPHISAYMVKNHIVKTRQQAFDKYLAKGRRWYVPNEGVDLDDAIQAITLSGGIPVIAHPLSLYVSWGKMESVISGICERGIRGIEAWHPGARVAECVRLEKLARKLGIFVTAGSDFHGEGIRSDRKIGQTSGMKPIEDRFWTEELKPRLLSL